MPLTRDFRETLREQLRKRPNLCQRLLAESVECMTAGEVDTGKLLMRDLINASVGFQQLGRDLEKTPASLMRMLSPSGNPRAKNLFQVVEQLQRYQRIRLQVQAVPAKLRKRSKVRPISPAPASNVTPEKEVVAR